MAPIGARKTEEKGTSEVVADLWQLVRDYAKQETIDPLKSIGRFIGYGLGGAAALGLGTIFAILAVLRALQTETGSKLTGSLDWVPYLVAFLLSLVVVVVAVRAISKLNRAAEARS